MMTKKNSSPLASRLIHLPPSAPYLLRYKNLVISILQTGSRWSRCF